MAELEERMARIETNVEQLQKTMSEDVKHTLSKIWDKVDILPCAVHNEKFKSIQARVSWLYFAFVVVIIGGIVLGIWIKYI